MELEYIQFISGTTFYSGRFKTYSNIIYYESIGYDTAQNDVIIYRLNATGLTFYDNLGLLGNPSTFIGIDKSSSPIYCGGEYYEQISRIYTGSYASTLTFEFVFSDYLAYHSPKFMSGYVFYIVSNSNECGIVSYELIYVSTSSSIDYYRLERVNHLLYDSTLSNPGTELNANSLINVNGYLIGGFVDVGLMSFSFDTDGVLSQEDRISGGTNNYVQSVASYGNYIYYTSAGSSANALQMIELGVNGTFGTPTTIVSTGSTAGAITIKGNKLYYGSQMELHKYTIDDNDGSLTHDITYDLSTTYFTSAIIRDINIVTDSDYMVLETTEGRVLILEKGDPISAGSKNRVLFMT